MALLNPTGFEKGATLEVFSSYNKDLKPEILGQDQYTLLNLNGCPALYFFL